MNYPFKRIITDINNYFFLRRTIKKNQESIEWKKLNLRVDWINRIYTVVNLPPEVIYSPDSPEEIRPAYVLEESRPINQYLTSLNLQEIITPEIKPIPGSISYLIIYNPYFQRLSLRWILYRIFLILVLIWAQHKFNLFGWLKEIMLKTYEFIF
jgi:hypothetical protein